MIVARTSLSPTEVARLENERMREAGDHVESHDLTEQERDARDLEALARLNAGETKQEICARIGQSRGWLNRILRDIRQDEVAE